jgi:hypothetical protein
MAISHADHDHPNTPAARAACRKAMTSGVCTCNDSARTEAQRGKILIHAPGCPQKFVAVASSAKQGPAQMTVIPRKRGDGGVVKGMKAAKPVELKKEGRLLKDIGDLPDVPRMLAYGARLAWSVDWEVRVGTPFNDTESRIVVKGALAEIALVWKSSMPNGVWGVFVRNWNSSKTFRVDNVQLAFEVAMSPEAWDAYGNLV